MVTRARPCLDFGVRLLPLALVLACGGGDLSLPTDTETERLELVDGDEQVGRPGERLPEALVVRLVDGEGRGLADRTVTWVVSGGGGRVAPSAGMTDGDGFARAEWTLGPRVGTNTAEAVVSHVGLVTFTATASDGESPPGLALEPTEGDGQSAPAGSAVPIRPAVRVTLDGEPVAGVPVAFAVTAGGGAGEGAEKVTNGDGIARVDAWVLGATAGTNRLAATAEGVESGPVVFTAEATAGSGVARMVFVVVPPSRADVREPFRVEVALVDDDGEVVPLSGIVVYLALFRNDNDVPTNGLLLGDRFRETENGVAVFDDLAVGEDGRYRLRALTDDLPEHGEAGPRPPLFSDQFVVD